MGPVGETNVTGGQAVAGRPGPRESHKEDKEDKEDKGGTNEAGGAAAETVRTPRATRTREAVVDALLALLDQGNMRPTAREVADKANVSLRSVYVHFDDVEALFLAAAVRHRSRVEEVLGELVVNGTFEERLQAFVERRARILEISPNVRRAGNLQEPFSPAIHEALTTVRGLLRGAIEAVFAPELEAAEPAVQRFQRSAVLIAVSSAAWDDMRLRQNLSVEETKGVVSGMVRLVFQQAQDAR